MSDDFLVFLGVTLSILGVVGATAGLIAFGCPPDAYSEGWTPLRVTLLSVGGAFPLAAMIGFLAAVES